MQNQLIIFNHLFCIQCFHICFLFLTTLHWSRYYYSFLKAKKIKVQERQKNCCSSFDYKVVWFELMSSDSTAQTLVLRFTSQWNDFLHTWIFTVHIYACSDKPVLPKPSPVSSHLLVSGVCIFLPWPISTTSLENSLVLNSLL